MLAAARAEGRATYPGSRSVRFPAGAAAGFHATRGRAGRACALGARFRAAPRGCARQCQVAVVDMGADPVALVGIGDQPVILGLGDAGRPASS
jgi:hypothetical protein